eukprot:3130621-Amphidinium_carterae.1
MPANSEKDARLLQGEGPKLRGSMIVIVGVILVTFVVSVMIVIVVGDEWGVQNAPMLRKPDE